MNYPEAIQFLYRLQMFGTKMGLENTFKLAALAGNPQEKLRFIHVAGTNGKGSTCAMLESIYRTAGLRTGLFTSPHLVAFGERIQINRQPIPDEDVARLVTGLKPLLNQFPAGHHPTFFEIVTILALLYFREQKCDLVIWETGLGGRLDATNIVTPLASVITNIQFDHEKWLGDTIEKIAAEKAGIIKPGVPVITAVEDGKALRILFETARINDSPFSLITWTQAEFPPMRDVVLPLLGEHQRLNAAVAVYTVRAVRPTIPVDDTTIQNGLRRVHWAGRLQLVERDGRKILLDGAHNPGGAEALRVALHTFFGAQKPVLILGLLEDKDCRRMCDILAPLAARILLVPVKSSRTSAPEGLAGLCRAANPDAEVATLPSLQAALAATDSEPFVVVAGSLYLIGEAMELLELSPAKLFNERNLNEWSAANPQPSNPP